MNQAIPMAPEGVTRSEEGTARHADAIVGEFKPAFDAALKSSKIYAATRVAMSAAENLFFCGDAESIRQIIWDEFFSHLKTNYVCQYQCLDFEIVDYEMYRLLQRRRLLRGPAPNTRDIAGGNYVTFFGAAQLFGRYHSKAPHRRVMEEIGIPCINHSIGGAGPETFCSRQILDVANRGKAVVVQIFSGRSVGCDEYPGGRLTVRQGGASKLDRLQLLREIWGDSRHEAIRLVRKWQSRYVEIMSKLLQRIERPVVLAWISERRPDDWSPERMEYDADFGKFPQLIDRPMVEAITSLGAHFVSLSSDEGLPHSFVNRFTGETCPAFRPNGTLVWENAYYPSVSASAQISALIASALKGSIG